MGLRDHEPGLELTQRLPYRTTRRDASLAVCHVRLIGTQTSEIAKCALRKRDCLGHT